MHIRNEITTRHAYGKEIIGNLMHAFMLTVLEIIEETTPRQHPANRGETLFHDFISLLVDNYREQHYIGYYAGRLSITPTYLSKLIRHQTGKTAGYFINGMLYAEAHRLLIRSDRSIQEISDELCFSDQSAFGKFFKSKAGISPRQFREKYGG